MNLGTHILLDLYNVDKDLLSNEVFIEESLIKGAEVACATILTKYFHKFGGGGGITGFLALAESHISIHTWPEFNTAAIDIYMCGNSQPEKAMEYFKHKFDALKFTSKIINRGSNQ